MSETAPIIYCHVRARAQMSGWARGGALALGCAALAVLLTAAMLTPNARGTGTHTQLGLAPCAWKQWFGLPCPSCGMTTSFAYFARGNMLASLYVQPMGMVLALLTAAGVWGALYIAISGRPVHRLLGNLPMRYGVVPLMAWGIAAWGWKIALTLGRIDGWR